MALSVVPALVAFFAVITSDMGGGAVFVGIVASLAMAATVAVFMFAWPIFTIVFCVWLAIHEWNKDAENRYIRAHLEEICQRKETRMNNPTFCQWRREEVKRAFRLQEEAKAAPRAAGGA